MKGAATCAPKVCRCALTLATSAVLTLTLAACSPLYDATFVNPCDMPVVVEAYSVPAGVVRAQGPGDTEVRASVPPLGTLHVEDAFRGNLDNKWAVRAVHDSAEHVVGVTGAQLEANGGIIALPAEVCDE